MSRSKSTYEPPSVLILYTPARLSMTDHTSFPTCARTADNRSSLTLLPTRLPPSRSIPFRAPSLSPAAPPTSGSASTRPRPVPNSRSGKVITVRSTASSSVRMARCLRVGARTGPSGCGSRGRKRMGCGSTTRRWRRPQWLSKARRAVCNPDLCSPQILDGRGTP